MHLLMHTKQPLLKQGIEKIELWLMSNNFTINTSILTKKNYDSENVTDEEKEGVTINCLK